VEEKQKNKKRQQLCEELVSQCGYSPLGNSNR
jgi:hypothetical protein